MSIRGLVLAAIGVAVGAAVACSVQDASADGQLDGPPDVRVDLQHVHVKNVNNSLERDVPCVIVQKATSQGAGVAVSCGW